MADAPEAAQRSGVAALAIGCVVGVILGVAAIAAVFQPDGPFVLMLGASGIVAVCLLLFVRGEVVPRAESPAQEEQPPVEDPPAPVEEPAHEEPPPVEEEDEDDEDPLESEIPDGVAALDLGSLLKERGDLDGAAEAYRRVVGTKDPMAGAAALNLGVLLAKSGDLEGAEEAYGHAVKAGGSVAKSAKVLLELLGDRRRSAA